MGFVADLSDAGDGGDQLFVSFDQGNNPDSNGTLAIIDTTTFDVTNIAVFDPPVPGAELTGTGGGHLFAFSPSADDGGSYIAQIDPMTATTVARDPVPGVVQGAGWAFGFWGGVFFTFTTPSQDALTTLVHRFDPVSKSVSQVAYGPNGDTIVGAGVSTCAPH